MRQFGQAAFDGPFRTVENLGDVGDPSGFRFTFQNKKLIPDMGSSHVPITL